MTENFEQTITTNDSIIVELFENQMGEQPWYTETWPKSQLKKYSRNQQIKN